MKTFFKLLFIFFLVFTIAGCKKKPSQVIVEQPNPPIEIQKTHIKFSSWGSESEVKILKSAIANFESINPDIEVEFIHIPSNYFQKLHLLIVSNAIPDVMFINNIQGMKYYQKGVFENLNPYFLHQEDFYENAIKAFSYNDCIYAVPRDISNLVIFYNKNMFDKNGVEYPTSNWNMADFLQKARSLTTKDSWGYGFERDSLFWLPFLWSNGGGIIDEAGCIMLDSENSKQALQFYSDLKNIEMVTPNDAQKGSYTNAQLFMQGKIGMLLSGRWSVPRFREDIKFDWDIAPFPNGKAGSIVNSDVSGWALSKKSKNKRAAWRLILYLSSQKTLTQFTKDGLIISSRKSVANSEVFLKKELPPHNAQIFLEVLKSAKPTPVTSNYQEIINKIQLQLDPVFTGHKKVNEVIDENFYKILQKEIK